MRLTKILVGITLVASALFVIVGEQLTGASADAFINARVSTGRAPISGTLALTAKPLGARLRAGEPLGSINDLLVDAVRLNDLSNERAQTQAETDRLRANLEAVDASIGLLSTRATSYAKERIRQLKSQVNAATSLANAADARLRSASLALGRSVALSARGIEAGANNERAQSLVEVSQLELENAKAQASATQVSLEAAERGTFLGDGYNDAPYSEQRIAELSLRRSELQGQIAAQQSSLAALDERLNAERLRVNRFSSAALASNVNGILWDYSAASGETVQRGEELYRLVDCDTAIVTLSVSESVYNRLQVGTPATFKLAGRAEGLAGTVTRLAGAGAETVYQNLAIAPSQKHLQRFDVALTVPALKDDPTLRCLVGRTGRVFFDRRPLDWVRDWWQ